MKLFLIGLNIFLVLLNGGLAGNYFTQGKMGLGAMNLGIALLWFLVAMLNAASLKYSNY